MSLFHHTPIHKISFRAPGNEEYTQTRFESIDKVNKHRFEFLSPLCSSSSGSSRVHFRLLLTCCLGFRLLEQKAYFVLDVFGAVEDSERDAFQFVYSGNIHTETCLVRGLFYVNKR